MISHQASVIRIDSLVKSYGGLRPLRLRRFTLDAGQRVGLAGFDQTMAEVFVNLTTGATLPEQGEVAVFGRATSSIADSAEWFATVDRFGIVSERIVLLDQFTAAQNIAMSLTLDIDPVPEAIRGSVDALGREVGLTGEALGAARWHRDHRVRQRVRLARAIAAHPSVLLIEHPRAGLGDDEVAAFAARSHAAVGRARPDRRRAGRRCRSRPAVCAASAGAEWRHRRADRAEEDRPALAADEIVTAN